MEFLYICMRVLFFMEADMGQLKSLKGDAKRVVLVDTSWLLYRSFHTHGSLSCKVGGIEVATGDIYGVISSVLTLCKYVTDASIILVLDDINNSRKEKMDSYKGQRNGAKGVYLKLREIIETASLLPHVYVAAGEGLEADDVISSLCTHLKECVEAVYIYSSDNDMLQLVGDNVFVFSKIRDKKLELLGRDHVFNKYGVEPSMLAFFRSFKGDKSDNLKGYPRIPTELVIFLTEGFISVEDFLYFGMDAFKATYKGKSEFKKSWYKWIQKVYDDSSVLVNNYSLMRLDGNAPFQLTQIKGSWDAIHKYQMEGTKRKIEKFLAMFPGADLTQGEYFHDE